MSTAQGSTVSGGQRALAWLSIGCARRVDGRSRRLLGAQPRRARRPSSSVWQSARAGAWWLITERPPRRWVGLGGAVVGLVIIVAAVVAAADGDWPLVRAALGAGAVRRDDRISAPGHGPAAARSGCPPAACRDASPSSGAHLQPVVGRWKGRPVRSRRAGQRAGRGDRDARPWTRPRAARPRCHRPGSGLPRDGGWRRFTGPRGVDRGRVRGPVRRCHGGHTEPLRPGPRSRPRRPSHERSRVPGRDRTADRLRHGQRPVLRQQRLPRRLRGARAAGRLPRREGGDDQDDAARVARQDDRTLRPPVRRAGRHRGRRRVHHPGLEQPVRARLLDRRRATTPHRHRRARCHRPHRNHRQGRRRDPRPRRRRSTEPQPELARVHHRELRGPLAIGYGVRRRRRRGARDGRPRWCSASIQAVFVSWCPRETSTRRTDVAPATSASTTSSMSHGDDRDGVDVLAGAGARSSASVSPAPLLSAAAILPPASQQPGVHARHPWGGHSEGHRASDGGGAHSTRQGGTRPCDAVQVIRDGRRPMVGRTRSRSSSSRTPPVKPTWSRCVMAA